MRRHALLILACPRSGATALAGALAHAGAVAGRVLVQPPAGESTSTFQSGPLCALNERLLAALGLRWDALVAIPEKWRERPSVRALAAEADAVLAAEYGDAPQLVLHDPRLAITAPFWRERLEQAGIDAGVAIVVRRPVEVAASIAKREPFAPEKSLALWLHYLVQAERGTRGAARTLVVYDRLLDAPAGVLSHVLAETHAVLKLDRAAREAALTAIRPDLKRFGEGRALPTGTLYSGIDATLEDGYARLAELSPGTDLRRTVEAIVQAAYPSLTQAIPPWLAHELAVARNDAERQADALSAARAEAEALKQALANQEHARRAREREEAKLKERIDALSRAGNEEGRDARIDEVLDRLAGDVGRIAHTLSDQPAREQALRLELVQTQRDLEDERTTISKLSQALEDERASREAHAGKLAVAQAHLQTLIGEVEQLRGAETAWNAHNAALTDELDATRTALHSLESERDALRNEREQATQQLDQLKAELDSARTDLRILDNDRNALAARAQAVGDVAGALRDELARRATHESTLAGERDRLAAEVRAQGERIHALERDLSRRVAELSSVSGRHESATRVLAALERSWIGRKALAGTRRRPS